MLGLHSLARLPLRLFVLLLISSCPVYPGRVGVSVEPLTGQIVFQSTRDTHAENKYQLYRINADGTNLVRLTHDDFDYWFPSISHDGKHIAFAAFRSGNEELFTMNMDGSNIMQVTHGMWTAYQVAWSPDDTKLAFTSHNDIYVMNIDGSNLVNLTNNPANDQRPTWSPDGKYIAFGSSRDNFTSSILDNQIYVMNSDGSEPRRLTNYGISCTFPEWSPDGKSIAFVLFGEAIGGLYVMDADGANLRKVSIYGFMTAWSPDSKYLAVTRDDNSTHVSALFALNVASGQLIQLTDFAGYILYPSWGP